jgi:glucose/mannose-6-phosphate isomerase
VAGLAGALDTVGMLEAAAGLPEQVEAAMGLVDGLADDLAGLAEGAGIENIVVLGMGGSGIGGDVLAAVSAPFVPVPVTVVKGYEAPSFVGEATLCFALSFSGSTEETLEAAQQAAAAGARMVCASTGGQLADLAESWGALHVALPDIPMPRAGIGAVSIPPLLVLDALGLFPGARQHVLQAVEQLKRRRDQLLAGKGDAHRVAQAIGRRIPLCYGGGALGEVAAWRLKCQINENAKAPAFANTHPELCHNEICGWGNHGDVTRQVLTVVNLRHDFEHPQVARRFELTEDILLEATAGVQQLFAAGGSALAQLFDLILQGDFVSLHLAAELDVDPGPIPVLEDLKAALADRQRRMP